MEKIIPYPSKQVTAKLALEDYEFIVDLYNEFYPGRPDVSFKEFFQKLLYEFKALRENSQEDFSDLVRNLKESNIKLEAQIQAEELEYDRLLEQFDALKEELSANSNKQIDPNSIIVSIEPALDHFLSLCANKASNNLKREVTKAEILKNLFYEQIYSGPGNHLPIIWSKSEVRKVLSDFSKQQDTDNE